MKIADIKRIVARYFDMMPQTLNIKTRKPGIMIPRQIAHYFCNEHKLGTLGYIGKNVGGKDHATVLHSIKSVKNMIETSYVFQGHRMDHIISEIRTNIDLEESKNGTAKIFAQVFDHKRQRFVNQKSLIVNL